MTGRGRRSSLKPAENLLVRSAEGTLVRAASNGAPALVRTEPLGPELPDVRPDNGSEWSDRTRQIYESVRRSPVAGRYVASDWLILQDTMILQDDFFRSRRGRAIMAAELRQEYAQLGLTPASRAALKWDDNRASMTSAGPAGAGREGVEAQKRIEDRRSRFFLMMGESK